MYCSDCGAANRDGARFCAGCGAALSATEPPGNAVARVAPRALRASPTRPCPRCGAHTLVPYFHRPANLAKLLVAACLWFAPAVVFVLIRKDRVVCRGCGSLRGDEGELAPVQSLRIERIDSGTGSVPALAPRDPEVDTALASAAKKERSAIVLAVASVGCAGLSLTGAGVLVPAALCGIGAAVQFLRARALRRAAEAKQSRHEALRILDLAGRRQGRLTVTDVAASLQMNLQDAERALDRMVDGRRVDIDVDDEGRVSYVFPELAR